MTDGQPNGLYPPEENGGQDALTSIHRRIHCAATDDATDPENNLELDDIAIDHFLNELADIALAIVRRREQLNQ